MYHEAATYHYPLIGYRWHSILRFTVALSTIANCAISVPRNQLTLASCDCDAKKAIFHSFRRSKSDNELWQICLMRHIHRKGKNDLKGLGVNLI